MHGLNLGDFIRHYKDDTTLDIVGHARKTVGGQYWATPSDGKLKKNIKLVENALEMVLQLRGINFEWKDPDYFEKDPGTHMGLIAQEVEKVIPQWVSEDENGIKSISIEGFEALIIESIKSQQLTIDTLKDEISELKAKVSILKLT